MEENWGCEWLLKLLILSYIFCKYIYTYCCCFILFIDNNVKLTIFLFYRIQYQQKATINKPNNITGEDQYFVPLQQRAYCLTYSIVVCFLLVRK